MAYTVIKKPKSLLPFLCSCSFVELLNPIPCTKSRKKERQEAFIFIDKRQEVLEPVCDGALQNKKCFLSVIDCSTRGGRFAK